MTKKKELIEVKYHSELTEKQKALFSSTQAKRKHIIKNYNDLEKFLLQKENDRMIYEYDFGDGWEHEVILEKIIPSENKIIYPQCVDGKMNCPPEDCGGIGGFENMLYVLKNPDDEEYEGYIEWLGDDYDHAYFNVNETNEDLKLKNYGCFEL